MELLPLPNCVRLRRNVSCEIGPSTPDPEYVEVGLHSSLLPGNTFPVNGWKNGPVTGNFIQIPFGGMPSRLRSRPLGTPGRKPDNVPPARSAFKIEMAARIKAAREAAGLSQSDVEARLTRAVGYEVREFRKYESGAKPSFIPHDLLFHFAEMTGTTVGTLVAPLPFQANSTEQAPRVRTRSSRTGTY